ncbi:adhesion G-protein coupled receptor G5-like [Polypterus senegalus]|uniref:adhesion G-protein coupled receptor G5-like n=1 Tax=Polypterus senegalus TaxID=55291 RepID=UPI00196290E4|nr:adhesion G-protein coupled receptor G5-like [Polypterus senegalus]XP_039619127.1 adhesion G-protein coupled receptor G5-like [Polypterus senegalus]XP_039619128.1 adhesion G-protein coupled receptor G5-like [Polypterus senegalus]XP_039619129.1 adhesion G-protein coupled receptor G5-like [Polypterus senegalus]XP_039619131.1 adhesion G-protein coupled receptor G5-like [Polypterus senegalus]
MVLLNWICPLLLVLLITNKGESETAFKFCGFRNHTGEQSMNFDVSPGCEYITFSSNESTLSITGKITVSCQNSSHIKLPNDTSRKIMFCIHWDGFLDYLWIDYDSHIYHICEPSSPQQTCCTGLSHSEGGIESANGIKNASIQGDLITTKPQGYHKFSGETDDCAKTMCENPYSQEKPKSDLEKGYQISYGLDDKLMKANLSAKVNRFDLPCAYTTVFKVKDLEEISNKNVTPRSPSTDQWPSVHIPPSIVEKLNPKKRTTAKVVCTFFKSSELFKDKKRSDILNEDVVGISVENEVISNLKDPVIITFQHKTPFTNKTTQCVFWDIKSKDNEMFWNNKGCVTFQKESSTECHCNHLTYFAVLLQISNKPVADLKILTYITLCGCFISAFCCLLTFFLICWQRGRSTERFINKNLTCALFMLNTSFIINVLVNSDSEQLCIFLAALLHYCLLCTFTWMGIEGFHLYKKLCVVFRNEGPYYLRYLWASGWVLPLIAVVISVSTNVYGWYEIQTGQNTKVTMCWMKIQLAHYITNVGYFSLIFTLNLIMLCTTIYHLGTGSPFRKAAKIWSVLGLTVLLGTSWGIAFFSFGGLTKIAQYVFTILNSLQGFFLFLRYCFVVKTTRTSRYGTSTSSTTEGKPLSS